MDSEASGLGEQVDEHEEAEKAEREVETTSARSMLGGATITHKAFPFTTRNAHPHASSFSPNQHKLHNACKPPTLPCQPGIAVATANPCFLQPSNCPKRNSREFPQELIPLSKTCNQPSNRPTDATTESCHSNPSPVVLPCPKHYRELPQQLFPFS